MSKVIRTVRPVSALHSFRPRTFQRTFLSIPGTSSEPEILSATRILPYSSSSLYKLIADVDSYSTFLPYCLDSKVTKWSAPDKNGNKWPAEGDLKVGWHGIEEKFTSRVLCVPGSIVEALSGEAVSNIPKSDLAHHSETLNIQGQANHIFKSINTRWSVKPFHYKPPTGRPQTDKTEHPAREQTEVHLTIEFVFSNPLLAALSKPVTPKVAKMMVEAFEVRARKLLDGPGANV